MKQENPLFYLFKKLSWPVGLIVIAVTISSLGSITGLAVPFSLVNLLMNFLLKILTGCSLPHL